jgi:hypothetical protein
MNCCAAQAMITIHLDIFFANALPKDTNSHAADASIYLKIASPVA